MILELIKDGDPSEESPVGVRISYQTGKGTKRQTTVWLTDEEAQHFSNRLQSFAKGQGPRNEIIVKDR